MKKQCLVFLLVFIFLLISYTPYTTYAATGPQALYVALDGNDANDGSISHPLKSLTAARNKIRSLKAEGKCENGATVYVREGTYTVEEAFVLESEDSGTEKTPITYCNYPGEKVTFVGGHYINGKDFNKVSDQNILNRLIDSNARNHLYEFDLKTIGITDLGSKYLRGAYSYPQPYLDADFLDKPDSLPPEIIFNGSGMTLARYPNTGYMKVASVISAGWDSDNPNAQPLGTPFKIKVTDERIKKWTAAPKNSILMYGFWKFDWADQTVPIGSIDTNNMTITSQFGSTFGVVPNRSFYVYDLLEELDIAGEYYFDYETCKLYLYPPSDISTAEIVITTLDAPMFQLQNTEYITFSGIDVCGTKDRAYTITGGQHNTITDCEISYTAKKAVQISGYFNGIKNSYIHDVEGGVTLYGGDMAKLIPGNCYVENCEIERFSRLSNTYVSAIYLGGVGGYARYNEIHDGPHLAIEFGGNNNHIIYNEIYDVLKYTDDAGAIYGGLSWVDRGTEISYNYIHDLKATPHSGQSAEGLGAIYLDGGQCETEIVGNVFENISGKAIWLNGGRDNVIKNNVMVNCSSGLRFTDIMTSVDLSQHHYPSLNAASYVNTSAWKWNFPRLQKLLKLSDEEKRLPDGNLFANNVCYKTELANSTTSFSGQAVPISRYINVANNLVTNSDPGFVNLEERNYALKDDSVVFETLRGFKSIPFNQMGTLN